MTDPVIRALELEALAKEWDRRMNDGKTYIGTHQDELRALISAAREEAKPRYHCEGCGKDVLESDLSDDKTRHAVYLGEIEGGGADVDFCGLVAPPATAGLADIREALTRPSISDAQRIAEALRLIEASPLSPAGNDGKGRVQVFADGMLISDAPATKQGGEKK